MRTKLLLFAIFCALGNTLHAQFVYDDFEGNKFQNFGPRSGQLDSIFLNPSIDSINPSFTCAKYLRDSLLFDFITLYTQGFLVNPELYSSYDSSALKFKMKIFTTAPVGTFIEIQLGSSKDSSYPSGVHSQYQIATKKRNEWEEITFNFAQKPNGSLVDNASVDKITILFYPYSLSRDTFCFDDLSGPELTPELVGNIKKWSENLVVFPNPTSFKSINLRFDGEIGEEPLIKIYNHLGKVVKIEEALNFSAGLKTIDLKELTEGIYYLTLENTMQRKSCAFVLKSN